MNMEEELAAMKEIVSLLQEEMRLLKGNEESTSQTSHPMMQEIIYLREELATLREKTEKLESIQSERLKVGRDESIAHRDDSAVLATAAAIGVKGLPAPAGMTPEQLQEFKKQTLQINALQTKGKELEGKLAEAAKDLKKGIEKANEMETKENEDIQDIYKVIEQLNNSLSEKIAQQKVEVQKIAGDQPKPINYDPFNYGEAYGGDLVDFQARKRITEIKLLLQSLQAAMIQMKDSVKVSPSIDLGYRVVRLDQLVTATGFAQAIQDGEATTDDAMLLAQSVSREPGKVEYPRKEMFQTSAEQQSQWAITDSIMQTMYRLEVELGDMQKSLGKHDASSVQKTVEELQGVVRAMKEKQLDVRTVKRIIDEAVPAKKDRTSDASKMFPNLNINISNYITKSKFEEGIKTLQHSVDTITKRMAHIEGEMGARPSTAMAKKRTVPMDSACLSCDRSVASKLQSSAGTSLPEMSSFSPGLNPRIPMPNRSPPRFRQMLNRGYKIDLNNETVDIYSIPRPCGASYYTYWPKAPFYKGEATINKLPLAKDQPLQDMKCSYIRGIDGQIYIANRDSVSWDVCKGRPPISAMEATTFVRHRPDAQSLTGKAKSSQTSIMKDGQFVTTIAAEQEDPKRAGTEVGVYVEGTAAPSSLSKASHEPSQSDAAPTEQGATDTSSVPTANPGLENQAFFNTDESEQPAPDLGHIQAHEPENDNENAPYVKFPWLAKERDHNTNAHDIDPKTEARLRQLNLHHVHNMADAIIDLLNDPNDDDDTDTVLSSLGPAWLKPQWIPHPPLAKHSQKAETPSLPSYILSGTAAPGRRNSFVLPTANKLQKPREARFIIMKPPAPNSQRSFQKTQSSAKYPTVKSKHLASIKVSQATDQTKKKVHKQKRHGKKVTRSRKKYKRVDSRGHRALSWPAQKSHTNKSNHKLKARISHRRKLQRERQRKLLQKITEREKRFERQKQEMQEQAQMKRQYREEQQRQRALEVLRKREQLEIQRTKKLHTEHKGGKAEDKCRELRPGGDALVISTPAMRKEVERHAKLKSICHWLDLSNIKSNNRESLRSSDSEVSEARSHCRKSTSQRRTPRAERSVLPQHLSPRCDGGLSPSTAMPTTLDDGLRGNANTAKQSSNPRRTKKRVSSQPSVTKNKTRCQEQSLHHQQEDIYLNPLPLDLSLNISHNLGNSTSHSGSQESLIGPTVSATSLMADFSRRYQSGWDNNGSENIAHRHPPHSHLQCHCRAPRTRYDHTQCQQGRIDVDNIRKPLKQQFQVRPQLHLRNRLLPQLPVTKRNGELFRPDCRAYNPVFYESVSQTGGIVGPCFIVNACPNPLHQSEQKECVYKHVHPLHTPRPPDAPLKEPSPSIEIHGLPPTFTCAMCSGRVPVDYLRLPVARPRQAVTQRPLLAHAHENVREIKDSQRAARSCDTAQQQTFLSNKVCLEQTVPLNNLKGRGLSRSEHSKRNSNSPLEVYGTNNILRVKDRRGKNVGKSPDSHIDCALILMQWKTPECYTDRPASRSLRGW